MLRSYSAIPTPQSHPLPPQVALFFINRLYYMDTSRRIRNRIFFCLHITGPVPYNRLCCKAMEDYPSGRRGRTRNALGRSNGARVRIPCPPCVKFAQNADFSTFWAFFLSQIPWLHLVTPYFYTASLNGIIFVSVSSNSLLCSASVSVLYW